MNTLAMDAEQLFLSKTIFEEEVFREGFLS
ncbi:ribonuclease HII [Chlamydia psittaci Mat116]|nr:ribonuclease HII [Chlamydia psittaci Mat116]